MTAVGRRFGTCALKRLAAWSMAGALVIASLTATSAAASGAEVPATAADSVSQTIAKTADLSKFQPGNIISDAAFFNKGTMTQPQIQSFLESKVPTCRSGYTCLKDWYDTSRTTTGDAMCNAYSGGIRERASAIIYKVAQACGINPQVLIVMLQKEQGLVNHVWPSEWRYTIAMGQGCPDTAACDTRYYGFFNQVYGAAWQMKRYANPPGTNAYFTWFAPGKTWNVRWHPNAACGSAPVLIQNQATANLYYYTPYQPNAAAIRAGYGEGDGCSAYGNRNFYQYYTDWFGSTQSASALAGPALVQSAEPVYFVADGVRHHVSAADFREFQAAFGAPSRVPDATIAGLRDGGSASLLVRNTATGDVSLLQDRSLHRFSTCGQVALWGYRCGSEMAIAGGVFTSIAQGAAMSSFARVADSSRLHLLGSGTMSPIYDAATAASLNGGSAPFAAVLRDSVAAGLMRGLMRFAPNALLTVAGSPRVYLPTSDGQLLHVPSWARSSELGLPLTVRWPDVPVADVAGYAATAELTEFLACGDTTFYAASGVLEPVTTAAAAGFVITRLPASDCAGWAKSAAKALSAVFVRVGGQPEVYAAQNGVYRHVTSSAVLRAMNGGQWPTVLVVGAASLAGYTKGAPIERVEYPAGTLVKSDSSPRVYLTTGDGRRLYLRAWAIVDELGIARSTVRTITTAEMDAYRDGGDLSVFVSCGDLRFIGSAGTLHPVAASATTGFAVTGLDAATCALTARSAAQTLDALYVQAKGTSAIYALSQGSLRHVTSMSVLLRLGAGAMPTVLTVLPDTLRLFPAGEPLT